MPDGVPMPEAPAGELPGWAVPAAAEQAPPRRPGAIGERARRALLRKRRRSFVLLGSVVVAIGAVIATVLLVGSGTQSATLPDGWVTQFQPDELQQVPNACQAISAATVQQYLPGPVKVSAPLPVNGKLGSGCNWVLDQPPTYRLLQLNMLASAPSLLAGGNGSATNAAIDNFRSMLHGLQHPGAGAPVATVTTLAGLGDEAFSSMQVFKAGGDTTDVATVTFRHKNVIVSAIVDGLVAHNSKGTYGPVDQAQLAATALAVARAAASTLR